MARGGSVPKIRLDANTSWGWWLSISMKPYFLHGILTSCLYHTTFTFHSQHSYSLFNFLWPFFQIHNPFFKNKNKTLQLSSPSTLNATSQHLNASILSSSKFKTTQSWKNSPFSSIDYRPRDHYWLGLQLIYWMAETYDRLYSLDKLILVCFTSRY